MWPGREVNKSFLRCDIIQKLEVSYCLEPLSAFHHCDNGHVSVSNELGLNPLDLLGLAVGRISREQRGMLNLGEPCKCDGTEAKHVLKLAPGRSQQDPWDSDGQ